MVATVHVYARITSIYMQYAHVNMNLTTAYTCTIMTMTAHIAGVAEIIKKKQNKKCIIGFRCIHLWHTGKDNILETVKGH